jgi:hypothetical protein
MQMKNYASMAEYYPAMVPKPEPEAGEWQTVDPKTNPFERYRAVRGRLEYRVFHGPEAASDFLPWILVVREVGKNGVLARIHHGTYRTDYEARRAAVQWEGPAPQ